MKELTLGEMIRAARIRRGWTQEDVARQLGVKDSYVSQWETGARKWPQEYIRPLAELLGLSQLEMAVAAGLIDRPEVEAPPLDQRVLDFIEMLPYLSDAALESIRMMAAYGRQQAEKKHNDGYGSTQPKRVLTS